MKESFPFWGRIPLFFVFWIVLVIAFGIPLFIYDTFRDANQCSALEWKQWYNLISILVQLCATLSAAYIALKVFESASFKELGLSFKGHWFDALMGMALAVSIYAIGFVVLWQSGELVVESVHWGVQDLLYGFVLFVLVAVNEEVMCRGYLLGTMMRGMPNARWARYLSLVFISLVFASMHLLNDHVTVLSFINLVLAGLLLGVTFLYTHNLAFPITFHFFWNWIQGSVLGFNVSGTELNTMLKLSYPKGYNIYNGGAFGFEGSIWCAILSLMALALLIYWMERPSSRGRCACDLDQ